MTTRKEINNKAADLLEKLAAELEESKEETKELKKELAKKKKEEKLNSLKDGKKIDPEMADKLSELNKESFDKVMDTFGYLQGDFGVVEKRASDLGGDLDSVRNDVKDYLME